MKKTVIYTSLFAALFLAACQSNTNQGTSGIRLPVANSALHRYRTPQQKQAHLRLARQKVLVKQVLSQISKCLQLVQ